MSRQFSALILIAFCLIASSIAFNVPDTDSVVSPATSDKINYLQSSDFFNAKQTQAEKDIAAQEAAKKAKQQQQGGQQPQQRRDFDELVPILLRRDVTESQKHEVAKNEAYRANLNHVNANWQADSQNKLNNGQQPDQFPDVPPPDSHAPTA